jgi:hypothetical protein
MTLLGPLLLEIADFVQLLATMTSALARRV